MKKPSKKDSAVEDLLAILIILGCIAIAIWLLPILIVVVLFLLILAIIDDKGDDDDNDERK